MNFPVCKHRHSGVAETANPGSGNRESGNAETAITVLFLGCRIQPRISGQSIGLRRL